MESVAALIKADKSWLNLPRTRERQWGWRTPIEVMMRGWEQGNLKCSKNLSVLKIGIHTAGKIKRYICICFEKLQRKSNDYILLKSLIIRSHSCYWTGRIQFGCVIVYSHAALQRTLRTHNRELLQPKDEQHAKSLQWQFQPTRAGKCTEFCFTFMCDDI